MGGVAYLLLRRLRLPGVRAEWFLVFVHDKAPAPDGPAFRWAGDEDIDLLAAFDHGRAVIETRLGRGERCAIVESEGAIAAWVWIVPGGIYDEADLMFHLAPDETWAYDGLVAPDHRGRRLSPSLRVAVATDLRRSQKRRLLSTLDRLNTASLRASLKSGHDIAEFLQLQVGPFGVVRIASVRGTRWHRYRGRIHLRVPTSL